MGGLPSSGDIGTNSPPNPNGRGKQPDGSFSSIGLGDENDKDETQDRRPISHRLEEEQQPNKRTQCFIRQPAISSGRFVVLADPSVHGEGQGRAPELVHD